MASTRLFNDDPVDGSQASPDLLGRKKYARHAAALLRRVREQSDSGVLALIGPWGSGKSSVLQMTMEALKEDAPDPWSVAELNPWMYSDLESLTAALFAEIREALSKDARWSESRKRLSEFGQAISPMGTLTALVGFDSSPAIKEIAKRIGGDTSGAAAKRRAEQALREAGQPILVVMDDLDRLTPVELLLVFKLVRLVGRLPNVHYLLSYDEHTLLDVLRRSDLVGGEESRAREFLEKIVQVRLDLPAFRERDRVALVDHYLTTVLEDHGKELTEADIDRFSQAYVAHLQERLDTPRSIKRFLGQVDAGLGSVVDDIDIVDFLLVTFLRTSEPGVYAMVKRHRPELTGTSYTPTHTTPAAQMEQWRARMKKAGVAAEHIEGVLGVLGVLFAPIDAALKTTSSAGPGEAHRRRGIGSNDYFDRYTTFAVPDDDMSEAFFHRAMEQVASGVPGDEYQTLLLRLRDDTHRTTRRISHCLNNGTAPAPGLLTLLAAEYSTVNGPAEQLGLFSPQSAVRILAINLLSAVPQADRADLLQRMAQTADGTVLAIQALRGAAFPQGSDPAGSLSDDAYLDLWARNSRDVLADRLREHLSAAAARPADQMTVSEVELALFWNHLTPGQAKAWIRSQLDCGTWDLLPLLVQITPPDLLRDKPGGTPVLPAVDLGRFDALIGLEYIQAVLAGSIDTAEPTFTHPTGAEATPELRKQQILSALRRQRDQSTPPAS